MAKHNRWILWLFPILLLLPVSVVSWFDCGPRSKFTRTTRLESTDCDLLRLVLDVEPSPSKYVQIVTLNFNPDGTGTATWDLTDDQLPRGK